MESNSGIINLVRSEFVRLHGDSEDAMIVRSPGRINLIGEHTDYNEGFVLPSAINRAIYLAMAPHRGFEVSLTSLDFNEECRFDSRKPIKSEKSWANYIIGIVDALSRAGFDVGGFDCVFSGDIPIGAGMSSSAAVEAGLAFALDRTFGFGLDRPVIARLAQRSENEFVGVRCGIMDQFANLLSKGESALHLDCRSLDYEYVPFLSKDLKFILCDTGVKHSLASSEYNLRREQCEKGAGILSGFFPGVRTLRDVSIGMLDEHKEELGETVYKRCKYVVEENERVDVACRHLENDNYKGFGELLYVSHRGLRDEFEVSCIELDVLVEGAANVDGVLGSRMMGGGFGGCTLNLVETDSLDEFRNRMTETYRKETGRTPEMYECVLSTGTDMLQD